HGSCAGPRQVVVDRVAADEQGQLDCGEKGKQPRVPARRAFGAGRQVAPRAGAARVGECPPKERQSALRVESFMTRREPCPEPITAAVVERQPGVVHSPAWRLTDDQEACGGETAHDRARTERQKRRANRTTSDVPDQMVEVRCYFPKGVHQTE